MGLEYDCWCGIKHTGTYAQEDWRHHNCLHEDELVGIFSYDSNSVQKVMQALCGICGRSFVVDISGDIMQLDAKAE